ncbi:MAG: hypothetical protein QOK41_354 [Sphingomonadales bacterium]|jgi:hypothetical protein|nr:hypothetical protein [Sphingomonadales bacterium]
MDDDEAAPGLWSSIRDINASYVLFALGLITIALVIYIAVRVRPAKLSDIMPSNERFQTIAAAVALILIGLAGAAAIWQLAVQRDEESTLRAVLTSFKHLHFAYGIFAIGLIVFVAAFYVLYAREGTIADILKTFSLDGLRNSAFGTAVVLLTVVVIFSAVQYLWVSWISRDYTSIAPFVIAGSDDKQRGLALATALQSKLGEIQNDTQALNEVLQKEISAEDADPPNQAQDISERASLNVYRKLDFDLKFQGVDVGGILNWLVNSVAMRRALQITVAEQGETALVSGALSPDGSSHVHAMVKKDNERIVAAVAYSKLREHLIAQQEEFVGLDWEDIELLHHSIIAVTRLRARSQVTKQDFQVHHEAIAKLIAKAPKLERLLTLGAEVAMKAGKVDAALAYLDRTKEFLAEKRDEMDQATPDDENDKSGEEEFKRLRSEFIRKFVAQVVQRQRIISSCALPLAERLNAGDAPEAVFVDALAPHKALLRVGPIEKKRDVTVAIIGGVPQRELVAYPFESLGNWVPGKYGLDNFADTIGLIVSTLAPAANLVFVPLGKESSAHGLSLRANEHEIGEAVGTAVQAKADIVLIPFAAIAYRPRFEAVLRYANNAVIVVPALSKTIQARLPKGSPEVASIPALFVASSDVDGRFKGALLSFNDELTSYPGAVWAPGMRIPRLTGDGMWLTTYGSPYAVATAVAVAANVAAASADKVAPGELVALLKASLRSPGDRHSDVHLIDQSAALKAAAPPPAAGAPAHSICGEGPAVEEAKVGAPDKAGKGRTEDAGKENKDGKGSTASK